MKRSMIARVLGCALSLGWLASSATARDAALPAGADFGAPIELERVTSVDDVVRHAERFENRTILVSGRVSDVCQKKGCWTVLRGESESIRIRFADYAFFVPKDSQGRLAYAEGVVEVAKPDPDAIAHYASESKQPPPEARDSDRTVSFTATGIRFVDR